MGSHSDSVKKITFEFDDRVDTPIAIARELLDEEWMPDNADVDHLAADVSSALWEQLGTVKALVEERRRTGSFNSGGYFTVVLVHYIICHGEM